MTPRDKNVEYVLSAAIWYRDGNVYNEQPKNIPSGIVICGRRHNNCIMTIQQLLGDKFRAELLERTDFGFITSHDRYVNRSDGFKIAKAQDQIWHTLFDKEVYREEVKINFGGEDMAHLDENILTSEDLYYDIEN
jgi:hypothetical protein